jgi:type II secretory pathway pseudopilin PulG
MLTGREHAFTLIELVVAMMITLMVLAAFAVAFRQAFVRVAEVDGQSISAAKVTEALDRIGDDLRSARSVARGEIDDISTRDDLKTRMNAEPDRYNDVARASGGVLAVWTDGQSGSAGPRCVTYAFEQRMDDRLVWALVRRSTSVASPCPSAAGTPSEVLALLGTAPPAHDAFEYGVLTSTGPNTCRVQRRSPGVGQLTAAQRLRIISIDVDLGSIATRRGKQRVANGRTSVDLWSRLNDDYYYAVGCSL